MDGRFAAIEEMMKKMLEDKQKTTTSENTGNHGRGNPNPFRGRENPEVEVLGAEDGMPPLEPFSREEMSQAYDRRGANFMGRREEFSHRAADFEGRRRNYDEEFKYDRRREDRWIPLLLEWPRGNGVVVVPWTLQQSIDQNCGALS
ncbi:hypothetical protein M5K25_020406 [Dendrobium thyrsiflorum]|uniref:Uncharacterized protein n=1 Tax=Dendrobium thyrsiflorum TaxID=117978 RepID=A0ABD0UAI2_DENTH